ncbi:MAG: purine-nucleoside phosphorylase [Gemmatimonadetes bacterium]|nr:purine-nucleoside phosphorylase [Gemmatimonadota bacterium]MCY3944609.1 purine-nucleoside phosphorylase [Gemmatimonadota bacterium]
MTGERSTAGQGTVAHEMARLSEAARAVQALWDDTPRVGLVLGTGLRGLADAIERGTVVPYEDLPHFPLPAAPAQQGGLICGALEDVPVLAMQRRLHRYEGYTLAQVAFPVRVMRLLGAEALVVTAACGAMNPLWAPGDVVVLDDHINLMGDSPLVGPNLDDIGPRFPDMSAPYDPALQELATRVALSQGTALRRGVYAAVVGPQLETRAEYRMLRRMGVDVVGMSTVPEVIAARHAGMRVLALAVVTDMCLPDALEEVEIEAIVATAQAAEPTLTGIVRGVLREALWSE